MLCLFVIQMGLMKLRVFVIYINVVSLVYYLITHLYLFKD